MVNTIFMLFLSLTVNGCVIISTLSAINFISDVVPVRYSPPPSDYEVAFNQAQFKCAKVGQKANVKPITIRANGDYTVADFGCVPLSPDIKKSGNVSNLSSPPNYK